MSRQKNRGPQQRRRTKPTLRAVPDLPEEPSEPEELELLVGVREQLRTGEPLGLLGLVSTLMSTLDPRSHDPFGSGEEPQVSLAELTESFTQVDYAETTALLSVIRALTPDQTLAVRIGKELVTRRQPMPHWVTELAAPMLDRVVRLRHVLGDGDDYFVGTRLPSGEPLTAVVYVDHNLGTVVKDAFVAHQDCDAVERLYRDKGDVEDCEFVGLDPADARATITAAIEKGAMTYPQPESEDWPASRPLVEWLVRALPEGGEPEQPRQWSEEELAELRSEFLASSYGEGLDEDQRGLLETLTWFGSGYSGCDPLRWSPVNVEILLAQWLPRKVVAPVQYLSKAPDVLRGFVRFCDQRRGIRPALTSETLAAVDRWDPVYQRLIRSDRPQGAEALLGSLVEGYVDEVDVAEMVLDELDRAVGGRDALLSLHTEPLPDEPFDWSGIPEDLHDRVGEVLALCDRCADELFDVEHRTAFRRFLARATAADPSIFRRKNTAERSAAAVAWVITKSNESVGPYKRTQAKDLHAWFGVKGGSSQRAQAFLDALGVTDRIAGQMNLGTPDLLVAEQRQRLREERDEYLTGPGSR